MNYHDFLISLIKNILSHAKDANFEENIKKGNFYDKLIRNYHQYNSNDIKVYRKKTRIGKHYKFTKAALEAVPTYRELALDRLKTLRPKLQEIITTEAKSLADRMPAMLREKADESLKRVTDRVAADVKNEIPSLTPEHVKRLSDITVQGMAIESEKLQEQLQKLTSVEVERISKLLDTLDIETAVLMDEELLQQRFMHNILLIVDRTVAPTMSVLQTDSPFSTSDEL